MTNLEKITETLAKIQLTKNEISLVEGSIKEIKKNEAIKIAKKYEKEQEKLMEAAKKEEDENGGDEKERKKFRKFMRGKDEKIKTSVSSLVSSLQDEIREKKELLATLEKELSEIV